MAHVVIKVDNLVESIITRNSVEEFALKKGDVAVFSALFAFLAGSFRSLRRRRPFGADYGSLNSNIS